VDASESSNLTLHATLAAAPPQPPEQGRTDYCPTAAGCVFTSLSYRFSFRIVDADGNPTPRFPDYNTTFVAYRAGPKTATVAAPIGYADASGTLVLAGTSAHVTVSGTELILRMPRNSDFVNLPAGPTPGGFRVEALRASTAPEFCFPQVVVPSMGTYTCLPIDRPQPGASAPTAASHDWDNAPNRGFGRAFTFPEPSEPPAAQTTTTYSPPPPPPPGSTTTQPAPRATTTQAPQDLGTTAPATPPGATTTTASGTPTADAKKSPAPEAALLLVGIGALLAVRRRLSE
jgi:MYXO-CTERM domain-containing protein